MKWSPYDYARKRTAECSIDWPLKRIAQLMADENIGSLLVRDVEGKIVGLLTDKIIFRAIAEGDIETEKHVGELKLEPIVTANKGADIEEVMLKFKDAPSGRIVMVDDNGNFVGILKKKNIDRFSVFRAFRNLIRQ
jgi:predicted transcriptional regulator